MAKGWDLSDFGTPWPRGHLPPEATAAEFLVGCLDLERLQGNVQTAEEVNARGASQCGEAWRPVTDEELARMRSLAGELVARWFALPPDGEITLIRPEAR